MYVRIRHGGATTTMLSVIIVFAIAVPLMIWALSPSPVRKRSVAQGHHPTADLDVPPAGDGRRRP